MTTHRYRIVKVDTSIPSVREWYSRMHRACFPGVTDQPPYGDTWFAYLVGPYTRSPIAFASLWASARVDGGGYLARAGVLPGNRGAGLQRRLIKTRERQAKLKGWHVLFSDVEPGNAHSLNNLFACGFRAFVPSEPWSGGNWIYLKKIIDEGVG